MPDAPTTSTACTTLLDQIVQVRPREVSGSRSSNRSDYQKSWAFCLLLKLHRTEQDYLILFDYHDDVVVLDSAENPTSIDFYQVKTKEKGNWTVTRLLKREKGANDEPLTSIVGKMYANKIAFPAAAKSLNFISNAQFKVKLRINPESEVVVDRFELADLCKKALQDFSQRIQEEHNLNYCPLCDILTKFTSDSLSLEGHVAHTVGEFATFLDEIEPGGKFAIVAGQRAIATTISRKNNHERTPVTKEELLASKGISRADFEQMLSTIISQQVDKERWNAIRQTLSTEAFSFGEITRWHSTWKKYAVERMDCSNSVLMRIQNAMKSAITASYQENPSLKLRELITGCLRRFDTMTNNASIPYTRDYLTTIILFEASEK